jgi:hypothetical protein
LEKTLSQVTYLRNHFVDTAIFASLAGISIDRLDQPIAHAAADKHRPPAFKQNSAG